MNYSDTAKKVLDEVIRLYEGYSKEYRASTQPFHLETIKTRLPDYVYKHDDLLIREPLIEHVGCLPVFATTLHPYISSSEVDLGKALIMLSIHDIGELVTGDEITFTKKQTSKDDEKIEALKLLPESLHSIYLEMEERKSITAQFAKAVDKMTPDIVDLVCPAEITIERYKVFTHKQPTEIIPMIKEFKHPYMIWDEFMTTLHLEILDRLDKKLEKYY